MLQPFELMKEIYLNKLVDLNKHFLVSQSYKRGSNQFAEEQKNDLLLSDYNDIGLAKGHLSAVRNDKYAAIVDLTRQEHFQKLKDMLLPGSEYRLFWAVVRSKKELETRLTTKYRENIKRYITVNTNWRIDRNATFLPALQLIYGELFIILKYRGETRRITFEQLEKS